MTDRPIKTTTRFPGFCSYHDKKIFEPIELSALTTYSDQHVFLFCLRAIAHERHLSEKTYKKSEMILKQFNDSVVSDALNETIHFNLRIRMILSKHRKIVTLKIFEMYYTFFSRYKIRKNLSTVKKITMQDYKVFDEVANKLVNQLKDKCYSCFHYKIIKIDGNKIAFSSVYNIANRKNCLLFLVVLPSKIETTIIIACFKNDYNYIIDDLFGQLCFAGDLESIQNLIELKTESIVFNGNHFDEDSWEKYIYETDDPIGKIFKPKLF